MSTRTHKVSALSLQLPPEYEDLTGVIDNDLKVIVGCLSDRATEQLLLSRSQSRQLRRSLWDNLVETINKEMEPLSARHR